MQQTLSVSNIENSIDHYCELLGFEQTWCYQKDTRTIVTQVIRGNCELILTENLDRKGKSRVFISLEPWELEKLEQEIQINKIPIERIFWGYPTIKISDPDGNELFFPLEDKK